MLGSISDSDMWQVISSKVRSPKNAAQTRRIVISFRPIPMLSFCCRRCKYVFKLFYFNLFKNILGCLSPLSFFLLFIKLSV